AVSPDAAFFIQCSAKKNLPGCAGFFNDMIGGSNNRTLGPGSPVLILKYVFSIVQRCNIIKALF
ncbi:MAG: hypothetical protein M9901_12675, partial [Lentimicrobium sp.]|nr:hypothetical protein [Lentimicrobium sp.]